MIAVTSEDGELLKALPWEDGKVVGYHQRFGFVSEAIGADRHSRRRRARLRSEEVPLSFQFALGDKTDFVLQGAENCVLERHEDGWWLFAANRKYSIQPLEKVQELPLPAHKKLLDYTPALALLLAALIAGVGFLIPHSQTVEAPKVVEQVLVDIKPQVERPKPVEIKTALDRIPEIKKQAPETKRAINQNLGFLGLLGRKDLKKAVGGAVTQLKDASPGAGPGGKDGSGGEFLVGLGQGLKRSTVGNTGVAGLGGIGTHGAGGGAGGYGSSAIGSGEGRALASASLSKDSVLEGGLDKSVVQATIAKYLSQVRACYEAGLKRRPELAGEVTVAFQVNGIGDLFKAAVQRTSLGDSGVESCITERMLGWKFPKPRGGVVVKASYPFVLRSTQN